MTLTLSVVIVGLLLLVGLPMVYISVQIQRRESAAEQQKIANQVAQTVAGIIRSIQTNPSQPALPNQDDPRINFVATQITTGLNLATARVLTQIQATLQTGRTLDSLFEANPQIQGAARYAPDGAVQETVWRAGEAWPNFSAFGQTELFALARQGLNAQDTLFSVREGTPTLLVAAPLSAEADIHNVVMVWVNVKTIWQALTDFQVGQTGYLYITDQAGRLLIAPSQFDAAHAPPTFQDAIAAGKSYPGLSGAQVVGRIAPIKNTPWQVVIEIPAAEANAGLRALLIILGAILLFGVSLAISVARLFSGWVLQPIQTLHQSALKISGGDLSHRITLNRDDELGFLARAFNQMVAALEETINELRAVSLRLLSAEEAERQRIAHQIHDELGQTLTALKFSLSIAARRHPSGGPAHGNRRARNGPHPVSRTPARHARRPGAAANPELVH
ncbi:MAG: HAMP domain-containing protein [Anaerolineae bacterium]